MPFEHSKKRIAAEVGALVGGVGALVLLAWAAVSGLMELAARYVPAQVERTLGKTLAGLVRQGHRPCESSEVSAAVESMARELAREAGLGDIHLEVTVLDGETVNAFALPGGHVFVFTGLLDKAESPDEVAGVLAHELAHVVLRHHVRSAVRGVGVGVALSAVLGNVDGLTAAVAGGSSEVLDRSFSRGHEEDADAFAVEVAARAGYDPAAVGRLLERMEQPGGPPSFLRTHPSGPDRRRRLEELAGEHPVEQGGRPDAPSMEVLRGGCSAGPPPPAAPVAPDWE